ncbi:uncharacterized protein LOC127714961 isoform X2 [Mytilus californianus]|uniref:uncharacterized protein LOC127714961 isoform X2 n=1 Tax=Mytilus californianus TaxID=6549 RepID=UPI002246F173|nr:uncharacterized protein LOC127714961 isoform X2 [Mytilus californianus]
MAQSAKQNFCEMCMSARGSQFCLDCNQYFCPNCKTSHLRIAVCRDHRFKNSVSATSDSSLFCQDHNESHVFICDKCDVPVCRICTVKSHKGHSMADIEETVSKKKNMFLASLNSTLNTDEVLELENSGTKLDQYEVMLDESVNSTVESIQRDGEMIKLSVDKVVDQMIQEVNTKSFKQKVLLNEAVKKTNDAKEFTKSLRCKEAEIRTSKDTIGLLLEMKSLECSFGKIKIPYIPTPLTFKYTKSMAKEDDIRALMGKVEIKVRRVFVDEEDVLSGTVFESVLSHGTTLRNEICMLEGKLKTLKNKNDTQALIFFYKNQMMNELSRSDIPKIVRVFIEIKSNKRPFVMSSVEELNMHVSGLVLAVTKDRPEADVVIIDNVELPNNIYTSWVKSGSHYAAEIALGQNFKGTSKLKQAASMLAILQGIGFHHEMTRLYSTLAKSKIQDKNQSQIIKRFDPYSILLLGSINLIEKGVWTFQVEDQNIEGLSELDKVVLNLLFPPCITNDYKPKVSKETGFLYCGRRVMTNHNHPATSRTNGHCGPDNGANCPSCRTIKEQTISKMQRLGTLGKFQGWSGMVYCNSSKKNCGPSYGKPCQSCYNNVLTAV